MARKNKNEDYWRNAALQREIAVQEEASQTAEEILDLYDKALDDINSEIAKIRFNFRKRYGLDEQTADFFLDEAQREDNLIMLTQELENAPNAKARRDILEYIHRDGLSKRAYSARIERFNAVKESIYARIKKLAVTETAILGGALKKAYSQSYYGMIDDTAKGLDVGISFGILNDTAIEKAVGAKWHGSRFSERVWKNTDRLAETAQEIAGRYIISGRSLREAENELADAFEVEKFHAETLIRTEVAHAHALADLKAYDDMDIEEYKYLATLDYRTCERCQPLDGMVFKLSEAKEGVNYPVIHPRCRCTTTINMSYSGRRARDPETGKTRIVDGDLTYEEWKESLTEEQQKALETAKKKDDRRTADKRQYAQYKHVLGTKNLPKTFDEWQDLKYNKTEENVRKYTELKHLFSEVDWQLKGQKNHNSGSVHTVPSSSTPNSVFDNYGKDGTLLQRRYYGRTGKPRLDIDMTDHGNPKKHTVVPHYHDWTTVDKTNDRWIRCEFHDKKPENWHIIANKDILKEDDDI